MMKQKIWKLVRPVVRPLGGAIIIVLFYLLRIFPIKKNKVLACVSGGRRYDDNQKFIMEELHKLIPDLDIVWVKDPKYEYELPTWMRPVKWRSWQWLYEYATAKMLARSLMVQSVESIAFIFALCLLLRCSTLFVKY